MTAVQVGGDNTSLSMMIKNMPPSCTHVIPGTAHSPTKKNTVLVMYFQGHPRDRHDRNKYILVPVSHNTATRTQYAGEPSNDGVVVLKVPGFGREMSEVSGGIR